MNENESSISQAEAALEAAEAQLGKDAMEVSYKLDVGGIRG